MYKKKKDKIEKQLLDEIEALELESIVDTDILSEKNCPRKHQERQIARSYDQISSSVDRRRRKTLSIFLQFRI